MSTTTEIAPVNPMSAEGKATVLNVMRRDRENFTRMVSDPKNWNVQTRCTEWETRDLVGHMIDVMEGYFKNWEAAVAGKEGTALGLPVMGETLNDHGESMRALQGPACFRCGIAGNSTPGSIRESMAPGKCIHFLKVTKPS